MENKLGIPENSIEKVERKLVNAKLNALDESFTFNENSFNASFLVKLNKFLLGDIYDDLGLRDDVFNEILNASISRIKECCNDKDTSTLLKTLENIWVYQPFKVGNTRTLVGFLRILDNAYDLNLNIDVNKDLDLDNIYSFTKGK